MHKGFRFAIEEKRYARLALKIFFLFGIPVSMASPAFGENESQVGVIRFSKGTRVFYSDTKKRIDSRRTAVNFSAGRPSSMVHSGFEVGAMVVGEDQLASDAASSDGSSVKVRSETSDCSLIIPHASYVQSVLVSELKVFAGGEWPLPQKDSACTSNPILLPYPRIGLGYHQPIDRALVTIDVQGFLEWSLMLGLGFAF